MAQSHSEGNAPMTPALALPRIAKDFDAPRAFK